MHIVELKLQFSLENKTCKS